MLQRAANHAYSWWWASHIRTKQSKWLEQSLQDMEEKVQGMVALIEGDGDSFAKRAEMYYRRRPELICAVEEAYKVFRSLADRYDLLSKDLQNANHTIATVFPEQMQFSMAEDEDMTKIPENFQVPEINLSKIPKAPTRDLKTIINKASKQFQVKKLRSQRSQKVIIKSGLSKEEALEEVSKLQKEILSLQTVKEYVKSSYESGIAKYWSIESQVMDMQQKISRLQDEFNMETVIEDEEARTLMAEAALKSCQETLVMLQEKQEKTTREAQDEYKRIQAACDRLKSLRQKHMLDKTGVAAEVGDESHKFSKDVADLIRETKEFEELPEKSEEHLDVSSLDSLSVTQLAEKIDLLVNKVFTLETAVSSQTVLVNTLRSETDDLNSQIRNLEDENANDDTQVLSNRVKSMEERLNKVQDLTKSVEIRNSKLETNFAKTRSSLHHIADKLTSVKEDDDGGGGGGGGGGGVDHVADEVKVAGSANKADEEAEANPSADQEELSSAKEEREQEGDGEVEDGADFDHASQKSVEADGEMEEKVRSESSDEDMHSAGEGEGEGEGEDTLTPRKTEGVEVEDERVTQRHSHRTVKEEETVETKSKAQEIDEEEDDDISWQQLLLSGMEDRERILLKEYTTILRNYKEVKKKLNEMEMKEKDSQFDTTLQMRELRKAISRRDGEIMKLRRKLMAKEGESDVKEDSVPLSSLLEEDEGFQSESDDVLSVTRDIKGPPIVDENDESRVIFLSKSLSMSRVEEKLRAAIDAILDENLDFWFRFSSAFHQIQKFKTEVRDLEDEISQLREKKTQAKSDVMPIYKHLTEIQRALTIWLEQSVPLKDELKNRFESLCSIQEEITKALKESEEGDGVRFRSHQAAKMQGEVTNMKQENEKVREELEVGMNHVSMLQLQIEKTLAKVNQEYEISSDQSENRHKVPLRSFIFGGSKSKKTMNSLFSYMHPSRKYQILRTGIRLSSHNNNNNTTS